MKAYFDSFEVPGYRLPTRPVGFGKLKRRSVLDRYVSGLRLPTSYVPSFLPNVGINRGEIDNGGSSRIRLPHVDVRPKRGAGLDVFYLVVPPDLAGETITAEWTATATDASGDMSGTVDIPVAARVPTFDELMRDAETAGPATRRRGNRLIMSRARRDCATYGRTRGALQEAA